MLAKKRRMALALALVLVLVGCAGNTGAPSSSAASLAQSPSATVESPSPPQEPASTPQVPSPRLAPLEVQREEGLSNQPLNWWFGRETGEDGIPLECIERQQEYGNLGLAALGPDAKAVYLTFDFGYETGYADSILDTLHQKKAKATFFVTLNYPKQSPDAMARMMEEGHSVGGHSATHPGAPQGITGLSPQQREEELSAVADYLQEAYGYESQLFRFPEGIYSPQTLMEAALLGQHSVFWSYAYQDYDPEAQPPAEESLQKALDAAHPGAIYLLHPQQTNADILGLLIDGLREQGYEVKALA